MLSAAGASSGAAIGTAIPIMGNLAGGLVGAATGSVMGMYLNKHLQPRILQLGLDICGLEEDDLFYFKTGREWTGWRCLSKGLRANCQSPEPVNPPVSGNRETVKPSEIHGLIQRQKAPAPRPFQRSRKATEPWPDRSSRVRFARRRPRDNGRIYSQNRVVSGHPAKEIKEVVMTVRELPVCDCP